MAEATVDIERNPTEEPLLPQVRLTQLPDLLMFYYKLDRGGEEGKMRKGEGRIKAMSRG